MLEQDQGRVKKKLQSRHSAVKYTSLLWMSAQGEKGPVLLSFVRLNRPRVTGVGNPHQLQSSAAGFPGYGKCQATLIIGFATCLSCNYILNIIGIIKPRMKVLTRTHIYMGLLLICIYVKFSYLKDVCLH